MRPNTLLILVLALTYPLLGLAQENNQYNLQRILQRYTEAYGGFRDANTLSSLSVEGTIEQQGQTYDFVMRKKRPYSFRYRLSSGVSSAITGYNGTDGWSRIEQAGEVAIESLEGTELRDLRELARFESPLFRHLEKRENRIEFIRADVFEERSVYVVQVVDSMNHTTHYYLDVNTAYLLRMDKLDESGQIQFQTIYRDYREVEGFPFAHEVETLSGGTTLSLARVGKIDVNPGLLSFYFEKPER